ncbi:ABC transporter permease [Pleionea sp. CnH1-48]|uniref:ABC transporter permease n=1 Tax=Pleionea sp. CnH1-48 TaxID=2954494 RepID=UPI0020980A60|nr:ABC transporter permease [Pleionea sp. CnH1-48]MCO7226810.1 ABC transporter permease [Pleionea sp. CnH1-48]
MFNFRRFGAIFGARNKEFWRDRSSLSWNFAFPLLLIFGFSVVFSDNNQNQFKMGLLNQVDAPAALESLKYTAYVEYKDKTIALKKVGQHQIDLLLDWDNQEYWVNNSSPKGYILEKLLLHSSSQLKRNEVTGDAIEYIDWVIPGILGMNIMFSCLFGVGYVIVRYRKNGVLKRLQATPVKTFEFVAAQIVSRMLIVMTVSSIVFMGTWLTLDFRVEGSLWTLLLILMIGSICLVALGLLVASRSESEELVGGLLNFASWPMMLLSGVWFSLEGAPEFIKIISQMLPLTHFVDAARLVMTEGATLTDVSQQLFILMLMALAFFICSGLMFNWGKNR